MSEYRDNARRLNNVLYALDSVYHDNERQIGVGPTEIVVMYALDDGAQHTQKQICQDWEIPRTTLNTIIKQWERAGYIKLTPIPGKRREMAIALTDAGREYARPALDQVYRAEEEAMATTVAKFSPDFIAALEHFTAALRAAFAQNT